MCDYLLKSVSSIVDSHWKNKVKLQEKEETGNRSDQAQFI